jgi:hypothetical protein
MPLLCYALPPKAYEACQRGKKRAEERAARAAEKAAKEATKQEAELKSYKSLMRVSWVDCQSLCSGLVGSGVGGAAEKAAKGGAKKGEGGNWCACRWLLLAALMALVHVQEKERAAGRLAGLQAGGCCCLILLLLLLLILLLLLLVIC